MNIIKTIKGFFGDRFFWELLDATHSPDSKSMTDLFNKYSNQY